MTNDSGINPGSETPPSLLEFPCRFPIKAMGRNVEAFEAVVQEIILSRASLAGEETIRIATSKAGNYLSLTAVIEAQSQDQLDSIYQALTDCELVVMAL